MVKAGVLELVPVAAIELDRANPGIRKFLANRIAALKKKHC